MISLDKFLEKHSICIYRFEGRVYHKLATLFKAKGRIPPPLCTPKGVYDLKLFFPSNFSGVKVIENELIIGEKDFMEMKEEVFFSILVSALIEFKRKPVITIGIDPGKNIGYVVLVADVIVGGGRAQGANILIELLESMLKYLSPQSFIIKIGSKTTLGFLFQLFSLRKNHPSKKVVIKIVDEGESVFKLGFLKDFLKTREKDFLAACAIALSDGEEIEAVG
ncbi:MAG: hypothetical protein J7L38_05340 [Thermoproteales archaeon]|nr:hypothetical protein [Thermoproteales archaeon]